MKLTSTILLVAATAIDAQTGASGGCNEQTRTAQITAGVTGYAEQPCATFSFSVAGTGFSTPASCAIGWAEYFGTVFSCGGTNPQLDCNPQGYQVTLEIHSGGSCPDVSGLVPGSWDDWDDVPEGIMAALTCNAPTSTSTFDFSAQTVRCTTGIHESALQNGDPVDFHGAYTATYYEGFPADLVAPPHGPILDRITDSTSAPADGLLHAIAAGYGPLAEIDFTASLVTERGGQVQRAMLAGTIDDTDSFDVTVTTNATLEGRLAPLVKSVSYDGAVARVWTAGAETGLAMLPSCAAFDTAFAVTRARLRPIATWLEDPFELAAGGTFDATHGADLTTVTRHHGAEQGAARTEYVIDASLQPPRLLSKRVFDSLGRVRATVTYTDHQQVASGVWRPTRIETTRFASPTDPSSATTTTLTVDRIATPTGATNFAWDDPTLRWIVVTD